MKIRSRSLWLPAVTLVATSCVTGAVLSFNDSARAVISTARPGAWMASSSAGSVSHVGPDGVDATVALPRSQGDLRVVQVDGVAYVTDADGRLSRIDPAQLEVSQETLLPSSNARLVAGGGRLYAVDAAAGTVRELDPVQLTSIGPAVFVGQPLGAAVVDEHGVLWVTDTTTGRVVAVDGHTVGSAHQVAAPGVDVRLSVVGPDIVAVNPSTSTATVVSGPATSEPHAIPREAGATLAVPDAVDEGQILPIVSGPHSLALLQVRTGQVRTVDLPTAGHRLGAPKVSGGKVYLPDFTTGSVLIVDIASAALTKTVTVTGKPGEFDLLVDGSTVYVNDPHSEHAWAITPTGELVPADKYDPNSPRGGTESGVVPPAPALPPPADGKGSEPPRPPDPSPPRPTVPTTATTEPEQERPSTTTTTSAPRLGNPGDRTTTTSTPTTADGSATSPNNTTTTTTPRGRGPGYGTTTTTATAPTTPGRGPGVAPGDDPGTTTTTADGGTAPDTSGDGAVGNLVAVSGDISAAVSWVAPTRWHPVTGYTVTLRAAGASAAAPATLAPVRLGPESTTYAASGLVNGRRYTVDVTAESKDGNGRTASSNPVVPAKNPPGAARITSVVPGDAEVTLVWGAPNGPRIDGYVLDVLDRQGATVASRSLPAGATTATVVGLANGVEYHAALYATVDDTGGPVLGAPATSSPFITRGRPGAPGSVIAAVTGSGRARVTWTSSNPNGSPLSGYSILATETAGGAAVVTGPTVAADKTQAELTGLKVGTGYTFTVTATNAYGSGSAVSPAIVIEFTDPPSAPGAVAAVAGYHTATVTWTAADGNGTTVASYIVRNLSDGTTRTVGGNATSFAFDNLAPGVSAVFDVRAIGANGTQGLSAATPAAVVIVGTPTPADLVATALSPTSIALTFDQPAPVGPAVLRWQITTVPDTGVHPIDASTPGPYTIDGLTPGTTYTVSMIAVDATGGLSPAVSASASTPTGAPGAVTGLTALVRLSSTTTGRLRVTISWTAVPGATSYRVDRGNGAAATIVTTISSAWTTLGDDGTYVATVTAINGFGESPPATASYDLPYYDPAISRCPNKPYCPQP